MLLSRLFRRRPPRLSTEYDYEVRSFQLSREGQVEYAQWLHPNESSKQIRQEEVDALRQFVSSGDFVIDIGAHSGDTTVPMALAAGPDGLTLALEPNPYVFQVLAKNASLNSEKSNIEARCLAATKEEGQFVFHYSDASFCNGGFKSQQKWPLFRRRYPLTVEGQNLLHLLQTEFADWLPKLTYVKVDAEGYDRAILESIRPILVEHRPVIRTEVFRKLVASERYAIYDLLTEIGYDMYRHQEGAHPFGPTLEDRREMVREKHFDILAKPRRESQTAAA